MWHRLGAKWFRFGQLRKPSCTLRASGSGKVQNVCMSQLSYQIYSLVVLLITLTNMLTISPIPTITTLKHLKHSSFHLFLNLPLSLNNIHINTLLYLYFTKIFLH
jgi:hypothetical protein